MVKLEEKGQGLDLKPGISCSFLFHEMHSLNQAKGNDGSSTVGQFQKHAENSNCFQAEKTKQSIDAKKLRIKNKDRLEQYQRPEAAV